MDVLVQVDGLDIIYGERTTWHVLDSASPIRTCPSYSSHPSACAVSAYWE
jgi:hypothetical protein